MNTHLNDDELQQYAIDKSALDIYLAQHVAGCEYCRLKALQYTQIADGLKLQPKMSFDFDLAALVLPERAPVVQRRFSWTGFALVASIVVGLAIIALGVAMLGQDISALFRTGGQLPLYLLPGLAAVAFMAGAILYYQQYRLRLSQMAFFK